MHRRLFSLLTITVAFCAVPAFAATPPPGGANQVNAVEGNLGDTLFNGEVRLRSGALRAASSDELSQILPASDKKVIVYTATMSNGTHENFTGLFDYAIVDPDGVSISAEGRYVEPNPPPNVPPGAAWQQEVAFLVPKDFVPAKIVITTTVKSNSRDTAKAFRINIDKSQLPQ